MTKKLGSEKSAVQDTLISYVREASAQYTSSKGDPITLHLDWKYVNREDAARMRYGERGLVFRDIFVRQIQKLNPQFMDDLLAGELIKQLEQLPANIEGNLLVWEYLKGLRSIFVSREKRERNVTFIDTDNIDNNIFQVTDELVFYNDSKEIRLDVVFFINGIPVFFVETKAANKLGGMNEALDQIKKYHRHCPELLAVLQVYAMTHIIQFYYSPTWNTSSKRIFNWKDDISGDYETLVKTFFDRRRILSFITDFILFTRQDDELKKVVLRPHQIQAVEKVVARCRDSKKKRGLIWHTQGSGKTFSMIVAAQKILENPLFKNPTVVMLVDRNELESQLFANFDSVGMEEIKIARSKKDLRKFLKNDYRGLLISMIHKFEGIEENINRRKNIFVLIDEAHRTTGGKLGNYLMGAIPNATYIGFTGTPIDRTQYGKGTFVVFGQEDPPQGYLDKYNIAESIHDGTTVPLHYALAPSELMVDKEVLDREFLSLAEAEGVSDIHDLNKILEKAVTLRNMLKNKERVEKVARYVVDHYQKYVEPLGFKAFLVAVDREACALYKKRLDKLLPKEYSAVVYSSNYNDAPHLAEHHLVDEEEKRIRKSFRNPAQMPKILIVTEKLLTGFDAPILYCMYLDKPMRDHVLLQAIARVNRPYEDEAGKKKSTGFVLDFVGIFHHLEKALAFDSKDIEGVVQDIALLKEEFAGLMGKAQTDYLAVLGHKSHDKAVESVLNAFRDEEQREIFFQFYRQLADIFDIISPDAFIRPYQDQFETVARMYRIVREAYHPSSLVDKDFSRKTAELVQEHTKSGQIKSGLEIYEINEGLIKKIEQEKATDTEKIFNLLKSVHNLVEEQSDQTPYLISIGEKAAKLVEMYQKRQKTTQEILDEVKKLIEEINTARREEAEKQMRKEVFTVFWLFQEAGVKNPETVARQMDEIFQKFPRWWRSENQRREVKQEIYAVLVRAKLEKREIGNLAQRTMNILQGNQS